MNDKHRNTLAALLVAACVSMLAPPVSADGLDGVLTDSALPTESQEVPSEPVLVVNVLDVSTSGVNAGYQNNGASLTDVQVAGVPAGVSGFDLVDPTGQVVFANQSSTMDGNVEFWQQALLPGVYQVVLTDEAGMQNPVAEFDTSPHAQVQEAIEATAADLAEQSSTTSSNTCSSAPSNSSTKSSGSSAQNSGSKQPSGSSSGTKTNGGSTSSTSGTATSGSTTKIGENTLWTPLLINHAPYLGSSTATAQWTSGKGFFAMPRSYQSSQTTGFTANIDVGGESKGAFQLAKWGYYQIVTPRDNCGFGGDTYYTAKVIDWQPQGYINWQSFSLWGSSKSTDADDSTSVSASGYGSVSFQSRWVSKDAQISTGPAVSAHVSSDRYSSIGATIGFGSSFVSGTLELYAYKSSGNSYTYNFPAGSKCWHIDHLGSGSSGGWAFKYIGASTC